jgi:undecaprenyl-diphosphatase
MLIEKDDTLIIPTSTEGVPRRAVRVAAALCAAGLLVLALDASISVKARGLMATTRWQYVFWEWAELFGDGLGVILYVLVIFLACRATRPYLPRVLICALGAGLLADLIKVLVVRLRPRAFDLGTGAWESFVGFRPWLAFQDSRLLWDSGTQSFPSAHTATAFGFAMGLGWLFPRWRWPVLVLAALVACQRVVVGAHFPSDVLVGAAVGHLLAALCLEPAALGGRLDAWETRARAACQQPRHEPGKRPLVQSNRTAA